MKCIFAYRVSSRWIFYPPDTQQQSPYTQQDSDNDAAWVKNTSAPRQSTRLWKLRDMAQEAMLRAMVKIKLPRTLARNRRPRNAEIHVGAPAILQLQTGRKGAPKWRGRAIISEIDGAGNTGKLKSRTFKTDQYCVRLRSAPMDQVKPWGPDVLPPKNDDVVDGVLAESRCAPEIPGNLDAAAPSTAVGSDRGGLRPHRQRCVLRLQSTRIRWNRKPPCVLPVSAIGLCLPTRTKFFGHSRPQ